MKKNGKRMFMTGSMLVAGFIVWTVLIQCVDVQLIGQNGTAVGFAEFNSWFHGLTGVHMMIYTITDWLGLVPIVVCILFGSKGVIQWVKRKSLLKVDVDIIFLGIYYIIIIFGYLIFEMIPINYRPILIAGVMEASYPSSTTLLVLGVMPTLIYQVNQRVKNTVIKKYITVFTSIFTVFMVVGRLICGVHWFTDIVGSVLLSRGLFYIYKGMVVMCYKEKIR